MFHTPKFLHLIEFEAFESLKSTDEEQAVWRQVRDLRKIGSAQLKNQKNNLSLLVFNHLSLPPYGHHQPNQPHNEHGKASIGQHDSPHQVVELERDSCCEHGSSEQGRGEGKTMFHWLVSGSIFLYHSKRNPIPNGTLKAPLFQISG